MARLVLDAPGRHLLQAGMSCRRACGMQKRQGSPIGLQPMPGHNGDLFRVFTGSAQVSTGLRPPGRTLETACLRLCEEGYRHFNTLSSEYIHHIHIYVHSPQRRAHRVLGPSGAPAELPRNACAAVLHPAAARGHADTVTIALRVLPSLFAGSMRIADDAAGSVRTAHRLERAHARGFSGWMDARRETCEKCHAHGANGHPGGNRDLRAVG